MADKLTPERRSWNMSRIRGKNTKPELLVRRLLHAKGYRYRLHGKAGAIRLPGNPDLVFAGRRKVIFVNGCFWHFHDCRVGLHAPKANAEFWAAKRSRTRDRDANQRSLLEDAGWQVLTVWECELKDSSTLETELVRFLETGR
ncbi:very short patch repair endonuclease [Arthrobacter sp. OY3WO11]|uniref:very short patch repair endonuclease n=1 Tax=Arthrobacter sp. OY3WO11 TaxID=1835723 RepID=UPI0007CFA8E0|nr:very short patch repair endonuclease [Arthrobacter sp. OY3WO11]OAE00889.1 very short patch repair endonuclease [Arthrobacter sp. OY3WO11]